MGDAVALMKLSRAQLRPFALSQLQKQGGLCEVCGLPIDVQVKGSKSDYVVDHDHTTGEIRGILHRSCNAALGKMDNAVGRWGAKSMQYEAIIAWMEKALAYYKKPGLGRMYPGHKTPEEQALAAKQKRNAAAALRKAKLKVKKGGEA